MSQVDRQACRHCHHEHGRTHVPAEQVADWAGNSVEVLLRTYAKCLVGQDEISKRRISEMLRRETWARIRHDQPPRADDSQTQPDTDT